MLSVSLGLSYIFQHRKSERHRFSRKNQSCMCSCDLFPGASHSLHGALSLLDLWRYFLDMILVSLFWYKILYSRCCPGFWGWEEVTVMPPANLQPLACCEESPVCHPILCFFPVVLSCNSQRAKPGAVCLTLVSRPLSRLNQGRGILLKLWSDCGAASQKLTWAQWWMQLPGVLMLPPWKGSDSYFSLQHNRSSSTAVQPSPIAEQWAEPGSKLCQNDRHSQKTPLQTSFLKSQNTC